MTPAALYCLEGRRALVTGGTRGIGHAISAMLAQAGAQVFITSEDEDAVAAAVQGFAERGLPVTGRMCDVTDEAGQAALIDEIESALGGLDILVCNAGISGLAGRFCDIGIADFDQVMATNLRSAAQLAHLSHRQLIRSDAASIIFISSISGIRGNATIGSYALAKAGLAQLARNLAVQWGPEGIRVNAIAPGFIATEFASPLLADEAFMQRRMAMTPLRRPGLPEEIAAVALFLASGASSFMTGQQIIVDGGTTITDGS